MIPVSTRARRARRDREQGEPLDGLVNLFDLGIVLSVGFLLAALSSLDLTDALTDPDTAQRVPAGQVTAPTGSETGPVAPTGEEVVGPGTAVGTVYQLADGRLVYVIPSPSPSAGATPPAVPTTPSTPAPTPSPTPAPAP
ncbi:hypothetical protein GCM10022215_00910 [Nocardioides fonticola]|uniref:DUF2149 domain-containing protein n=1 Tax=Nocardioides fonticola TaxID=450363 RepID=A0ABP7X980_9ACTN